MDATGEYHSTVTPETLFGITASRARSVRTLPMVKLIFLLAVAVISLAIVGQVCDLSSLRWHSRSWRSITEKQLFFIANRPDAALESSIWKMQNNAEYRRISTVPTRLNRARSPSWVLRGPNVDPSPGAPLIYDSWVFTRHCDGGYTCFVHLYMVQIADETEVVVGYQIKSLLSNLNVPQTTRARIAAMSEAQVNYIAHELVTQVGEGLEQPVCGVDIEFVKAAIKETAAEVLENCDFTNKIEACYPRKSVLRFPSAPLEKTYMLPTWQCSRKRYCRAVLDVHSINNCVSSRAGYKIFSVDDEVRSVDEGTKGRIDSTDREKACQWANTLINEVHEDLGDLGCDLDVEAVCDGMLAGAKTVISCTQTDQDSCLSLTDASCA